MKLLKLKYITSLLFLVLIYGFTIASLLTKQKTFSASENRVLQTRPEFSFEDLMSGKFISDYEKYVTDQFVFRDAWIGLKTYSELTLQKKDINGVYFAKDGYLIEKVDNTDIDQELLAKNEKRLIEFIKKYKEFLGENHVFAMIAPTAFEILSEKLPLFATGFDQGVFLDDLSQALSDNFIDLRTILNEHRKEYIFYKTDHHWTTDGAYYAYTAWAKAMGITPRSKDEFNRVVVSEDFLGTIYSKVNVSVKPDTMVMYEDPEKYEVEFNQDGKILDSFYEMSHLDTKDKYAAFLNGNNPLIKITSENTNGKTLLVIKDSYANCFVPFAAGHFETVYVVDLRFFNMPMSSFIKQYGVTDVLVLYNVNSYIKDKNLLNLTK